MPRKNNNRDSKSIDACVYCGEYVPPTDRTLRQKFPKSKVPLPKSVQQILNARIRKLKKLAEKPKPYRIRRHRFPKRKPKKQIQPPTKASNETCSEAPLSQPWQRDAPVMALQMGATPVEGELSPMFKGLILGLSLCTGRYQELGVAAGVVPPMTLDQNQDLLQTTSTPGSPAQGSNNAFLASENSSHEARNSAVIECPSQSRQWPPGLPDQPECPAQIINPKNIQTQTDSQWSLNSTINLIQEPDSSHLGNKPRRISMQEDDPLLKPDPVRKSETCLDEKKSQIGEPHNIGDCQSQSHQNQ